jgi:hypothetical protein
VLAERLVQLNIFFFWFYIGGVLRCVQEIKISGQGMETFSTTEKINVQNLNKIINSRVWVASDGDQAWETQVYAALTKLSKQLKSTGGNTQRVSFKVKKTDRICYGRLCEEIKGGYAVITLQNMEGNIRKALASDYYIDVDIKNCFPVILSQLLTKKGIPCEILENYVKNRDAYLDIAPKSEWNRYIHNGQPSREVDKTSAQWRFYTDVQESILQLLNLPENQHYLAVGKKMTQQKGRSNVIGSAIAHLLQDLERTIVSEAIHTFQDNGMTVGTVIHDGFLVEKGESQERYNEVMRCAEANVSSKIGYDVQLVQKPMDDYSPTLLWDETRPVIDPNMGDATAARTFLDWCNRRGLHLVRCGGKHCWYNDEEGIWVSEKNYNSLKPLMTQAGEMGYLPEPYAEMTVKKDALLKELTELVPNNQDFFIEANDTTYQRMAWNNGIYNFLTRQLEPFSHKYRFTAKLKYDYIEDDRDVHTEKLIYERVLDAIFLDADVNSKNREEQIKVRDYLMAILGRALAGEVNDKLFYMFVGLGNSGKGVLTTLIENTFGSGFVGVYNGDSLATTKHSDNTDIAKSNMWMIQLIDKRFAIANEIDPAKTVSTSKMKTFVSGGDGIQARQLHNNESKFKPAYTAFLMMNDVPKMDNADSATRDRTIYIRMPFRFVPAVVYAAAHAKAPTVTKKGDDTLKSTFLGDPHVAKVFARMVSDAYLPQQPVRPHLILKETEGWHQTEVSSENLLTGLIDETGNDKDFVPTESLFHRLDRACRIAGIVSPTKPKLKSLMSSLGHETTKAYVEGNRQLRGYKRIRIATATDPDDSESAPIVFSNDDF